MEVKFEPNSILKELFKSEKHLVGTCFSFKHKSLLKNDKIKTQGFDTLTTTVVL